MNRLKVIKETKIDIGSAPVITLEHDFNIYLDDGSSIYVKISEDGLKFYTHPLFNKELIIKPSSPTSFEMKFRKEV